MSDSGQTRFRVLVVGTRVPRLPLRDGYVLHLYHLLAHTQDRHDVLFVAPDDSQGEFTEIAGLKSVLAKTGRGGLDESVVFQVRRFRPEIMHLVGAPLAGIAKRADVPSVLGALDAPHLNIDAITPTNAVDWLRKHARRLFALWNIRRSYSHSDSVVVVSEEDRLALVRENSSLEVSVIANGVDLEAFEPRRHLARRPDHLLFSGALGYPPNVATAVFLAEEVLPIIRAKRPTARLSLVGRDPSEEVLALGQLPGVDVVGPVEDMAEALSTASVYVCPMVSGTGIKNKLLEAMANGLPCVASTLAVRGTTLRDGVEVLIADTAEDVAHAALRLLESEALRVELGEAGLRHVSARHTWSSMADQYSKVYEQVIRSATAGQP